MKKIIIRNHKNNTAIYSGTFQNMRQACEGAILDNVSLAMADLTNATLNNATLDGGDFRGAKLSGSSFIGANVSEADFTGATVTGSDFTSACLCDSRLVNVDVTGTSFGATLLAGAIIDNCIFSCPSALLLPLADAQLGRNIYTHEGKVITFTACPVVITGLPKRVALLDNTVLIGDKIYTRADAQLGFIKDLQNLCTRATG